MTGDTECKNCGATLAGRYCSACGQAADVRIPSFGRLLAEVAGDILSFDSRVWRSVSMLVTKPGRLTTRYLQGQRASYTPPLRLYLASSLVFFALFSLGRSGAPDDASIIVDELQATSANEGWHCGLDEGSAPALRDRLEAACRKIESDNGASFARALGSNVPLMMLVFIPVVAAVMRGLYLFSGRKYVEHVLFFAHLHSFFFLTAAATMVLSRIALFAPFAWLSVPLIVAIYIAWLYFPVYVYLAMRHVYRQGHALTTIKYVLLGASYLLALVVTFLGLVVYTALTI